VGGRPQAGRADMERPAVAEVTQRVNRSSKTSAQGQAGRQVSPPASEGSAEP